MGEGGKPLEKEGRKEEDEDEDEEDTVGQNRLIPRKIDLILAIYMDIGKVY